MDGRLGEFDEFFSPLAPMLHAFAERHNLQLEKYHHESASWDFEFRLSLDEIGKIQVLRTERNSVSLFGVREVWDLERFRRATRQWYGTEVSRDDPRLQGALDSLLAKIVTLPRNDLKFDTKDYSRLWAGQTDVIRRFIASKPLPTV